MLLLLLLAQSFISPFAARTTSKPSVPSMQGRNGSGLWFRVFALAFGREWENEGGKPPDADCPNIKDEQRYKRRGWEKAQGKGGVVLYLRR